jgi:hypothetical protein
MIDYGNGWRDLMNMIDHHEHTWELTWILALPGTTEAPMKLAITSLRYKASATKSHFSVGD